MSVIGTLTDLIKFTTATTGTGTLTVGTASAGFFTPAEVSLANGAKVTLLIKDGDDVELVEATYTASGTTFSRDTVRVSKISGTAGTTKLTLSGSATVSVVAGAYDLLTGIRQNRDVALQGTDVADSDGFFRLHTSLGATINSARAYSFNEVTHINSDGTDKIWVSAGGGDFGSGANQDCDFGARDLFLIPSASLTPPNNGDLRIQATSNTSLTFKYKGSDGTVRSGSVTLS